MKKTTLLAILLFIVSFLLRICLISKGAYSVDCLIMANRAQQTVQTGILNYMHSHGFPLTTILSVLFVFLAKLLSINDPIIAVNFMSVFFSSMVLIIFFYLVKHIIDSPAALISTALLSCSPIFLGTSVYGNTHMPSLFFSLCGFFLLFKYKSSKSTKTLLASGLLFGFAGAARIQDLAVVILPIILFLNFNFDKTAFSLKKSDKNRFSILKSHIVLGFTIILTVFIFYLPIFIIKNEGKAFFDYELTRRFCGLSPSLMHKSFQFFIINFNYIGLILIAIAMITLFAKRIKMFILLFTWAFIPYIAFSLLNIMTPRFLIVSLVPLYIAIGYLLSIFIKYSKNFKILSLCLLTLLISLSLIRIYPLLNERHEKSYIADYSRWIDETTESNAVLIAVDEAKFLKYYSDKKVLIRPTLFLSENITEELSKFFNIIDSLLKNDVPVYITGMGFHSYDDNHEFEKMFNINYKKEIVGWCYTEDWHRGSIYKQIGNDCLYKISIKNQH